MKDEEMAEESFEQYRTKDIDYVVSPYSEDNGTQILMFNNEYDAEEEYFRFYKQGFLAGLKAGRPQWHKVADGDLPKEDCKVYLAIAKGDTEPSLYDYIASEEGQWEWLPRRIAVLSNEQIEKWCEIPTFDKE